MISKSSTIAVMKENRKKRKTPTMNRGLWFKMGLLFILITFFMPVVNASKKLKDLTPGEKEAHKKRLLEAWKDKPQETSGKRKKMKMEIMMQNDEEVFNCDVCKKPCTNRESKKMGCKNDHKGHKECIDHWHEDHAKQNCPVCNKHVVAKRSKRDGERWLKFHAYESIGLWGLFTAISFAVFDTLYWASVLSPSYSVFVSVHFATVAFSFLSVLLLNCKNTGPKGSTILVKHTSEIPDYNHHCVPCWIGLFCEGITTITGKLIYDKIIPGNGTWAKAGWVSAFFVNFLLVLAVPFGGVHGEAAGEFFDNL